MKVIRAVFTKDVAPGLDLTDSNNYCVYTEPVGHRPFTDLLEIVASMLDKYPGKYMYQHFNINQRDEIFMLIRVEILETGVVLEEDDSRDLSMIVQDIKRIPLYNSHDYDKAVVDNYSPVCGSPPPYESLFG